VAKPESLFWQQVKKNLKAFSFIRLESWVNHGIPDVLGTTKEGIYFTVELKVTKSNRVSFSPHQISYHEERKNSPAFIMVKRVLDSSPRNPQIYIYSSDQVLSLDKQGLKTPPLSLSNPVNWSFVQEHLAFLIRRRTYDQLTGLERES
jgi:penicillin-binding protein-related factor A (putative recombinase)